jgi:hypothetical protein
MADPRRLMEATVLLCDYAVEVQGKLYITGGGWSQLRAGPPADICLAVKLAVPWDRADQRLPLQAALFTEDGVPAVGPAGEPIALTGEVQVGRPPDLPPGTSLDAPFALRFTGLVLAPGGYRWELSADDALAAVVPFRVVA